MTLSVNDIFRRLWYNGLFFYFVSAFEKYGVFVAYIPEDDYG
jgi:hypothetical protein